MGTENAPRGLIPQTLQPLLEKRLKLKALISNLDERDCQVKVMKQRAAALKWLLVVCFGYLGYKNARFGQIESHEAVTAISRELMLQAKEVAEELGFSAIHMYVDSLFVQKNGVKEDRDFEPLLQAITEQTNIPILLEGVYRWLCFPPAKRDARISVPNRYFGALHNGEVKYRGIEARRRDVPFWVKKIQLEALSRMARAGSLDEVSEYLPHIKEMVTQAKRDLRNGHVPLEELVVAQSLSRAAAGYVSPSPAARAAMQLNAAGNEVAPGQFMRFVFVRGAERVRVWELGVDARTVDTKKYCAMLDRAVAGLVVGFEKAEIGLGI
jgi:DNA polymerase-2